MTRAGREIGPFFIGGPPPAADSRLVASRQLR